MKNPSLVILAAGMGSRYGGLKQIDTVGNNGESIIDFSIYDAIQAGFKKVYLIIRKEHEEAFKKALVDKVRRFVDVEFIFQDMKELPQGFVAPEGREKPWGTTHALWICRHQVKEPFMICNADDYYGKDAFKKMFDFLTHEVKDDLYSMVGYRLSKTLSDSGTVSRGVCDVSDEILIDVNEYAKIKKVDGVISSGSDENGWKALNQDALVSMNFWGFTPRIFDLAEKQLTSFLQRELLNNPLKCEHVIPTMIGETIKSNAFTIRVLASESEWFGVTYIEDKPYVVSRFLEFKNQDMYPFDLWENK
jgi:NDP-sugar pyrophosphorylase family protein